MWASVPSLLESDGSPASVFMFAMSFWLPIHEPETYHRFSLFLFSRRAVCRADVDQAGAEGP